MKLAGLGVWLLLSLVMGGVLLFATKSDELPADATYTAGACAFPMPAGQVEGKDVFCGDIAVPALHDEPKRATFHLPVAEFKATGTPAEPTPSSGSRAAQAWARLAARRACSRRRSRRPSSASAISSSSTSGARARRRPGRIARKSRQGWRTQRSPAWSGNLR